MHILHVIDTLRPGGAQRALVEIANQTHTAGAAVSVCVTRDGLDMATTLHSGIAVLALERTRRLDCAAMRRIRAWVEARGVDVIHAHGRTTFRFLALLKTLAVIRGPLVMHDHSGRVGRDVAVPLWFRKWARTHAAHYVGVCAEADRWAARAGIPAGRRSVIPGALDLRDRFREAEGCCLPGLRNLSSALQASSPGGAAAIETVVSETAVQDRPARPLPREEFSVPSSVLAGVCLGGVRPEKGIDTLLAAAARSRRRGGFRIVVVGGVREEGYWRHCLRETRRLGLQNDIVFAGERGDIDGWLGGFDFAVHAARLESGPLAVIEHLAAGLPLVCTRVGGIARRAEELGVEGFVPPGDPDALALALDELIAASACERAARARRGRRIALRSFDIRVVMPAWRRVYEEVCGKPFVARSDSVAA